MCHKFQGLGRALPAKNASNPNHLPTTPQPHRKLSLSGFEIETPRGPSIIKRETHSAIPGPRYLTIKP